MRYFLFLVLFSSCVTTNKLNKWMLLHPSKSAELCLQQFPPINHYDTSYVYKDSLVIDKMTDTIYKWFTNYQIQDPIIKTKIKTILQPCKDSIQFINQTIYDTKYKILYDEKVNQYNESIQSIHHLRRWLFIIICCFILCLLIKYIESKA